MKQVRARQFYFPVAFNQLKEYHGNQAFPDDMALLGNMKTSILIKVLQIYTLTPQIEHMSSPKDFFGKSPDAEK